MTRSLEAGDIVEIAPRKMAAIRKAMPFNGSPQFKVAEIVKRNKWSFATVRVLKTPDDTEGTWLYRGYVRRVPTKRIRPEWKVTT